MDNLFWSIIIIIVLVILNGIFSAGEFAVISSRKSKLKEMVKGGGGDKARALLRMREKPENFLSLVQIGITIVGTLASAIGGIISITYVEPYVKRIPYVGAFSGTVSLIIVVIVLTYVIMVAGELLPKYIGINYRERAALRLLPVFELLSKVLFLPVWVLNTSVLSIMKLLGLKKTDEVIGEDEIKVLLEEGRLQGVFDSTEEELIQSVFEFVDRSVKEIMVPRPNIYALDIEKPQEENVRYIVENEFSRYPVYRGHLDRILGIVYQKDVMRSIWLDRPIELQALLKKAYFVPDTMKISALFKDMQKRRVHLAIVVDEYGTTAGIVALEDIMEEIFGEIMDETDVEVRVERNKDGSVVVDGSYSVRDLNNALDVGLPESPDYETLGGFILSQIQGIARGGEIVHYDGYRLTVVGIHGRRIAKVKIETLKRQ
ncbi:MAG: hemolysin family protein [Syntrophorhabdales bacterium]|jgi:putative hemolysin